MPRDADAAGGADGWWLRGGCSVSGLIGFSPVRWLQVSLVGCWVVLGRWFCEWLVASSRHGFNELMFWYGLGSEPLGALATGGTIRPRTANGFTSAVCGGGDHDGMTK